MRGKVVEGMATMEQAIVAYRDRLDRHPRFRASDDMKALYDMSLGVLKEMNDVIARHQPQVDQHNDNFSRGMVCMATMDAIRIQSILHYIEYLQSKIADSEPASPSAIG